VDWQLPLTLTLIASAGGYLGWRGLRSWRGSRKGCGGGCGCSKTASTSESVHENGMIPAEQLKIRPLKR
jgi:hypothetical protein